MAPNRINSDFDVSSKVTDWTELNDVLLRSPASSTLYITTPLLRSVLFSFTSLTLILTVASNKNKKTKTKRK